MTTFVLVPGAWSGGWLWRRITSQLRAAGHDVYPVTLTGLGDRSHLASPELRIETHLRDVANVIENEELEDVTLVGHSYAGCVVGGAAALVPDRIGRIVYVDATIPEAGRSMFDLAPPGFDEAVAADVAAFDGWRWPIPSREQMDLYGLAYGMTDEDIDWLRAKSTPHPVRTMRDPVPAITDHPKTIIVCDPEGSGPLILPTGHYPMLTMPDDLTALLLEHGVPAK